MSEPDVLSPNLQLEHFMQFIPHARECGIRFVARGDDWAEAELAWDEKLTAYGGVVASSAISTMMDSLAGLAVVATLGRMRPMATLDLRVDYLRPATSGAAITGRAECYKLTKSVAFVRGSAHDGDAARPLAHMAATFMFTAGAQA